MDFLFEQPIPKINGLSYFKNFITETEEKFLIKQIDKQFWLSDLKRRVQHYGYKYDYKARKITGNSKIVPYWLQYYCDKLNLEKTPNQAIINEYQQGQGISTHIDLPEAFDNEIAIISLLSPCIMVFENKEIGRKESIFLETRSLLKIKDEARYKWTHCIPNRKSNIINRRVSITFRKVIL